MSSANSKIYNSRRWRDHVQPLVLRRNPLCQYIDDRTMQQCSNKSSVVHHIADPKDRPDLAFAWSNFVAVCPFHHSGGTRGETQHNLYTHTMGWDHEIVRKGVGYPIWHQQHRALTARAAQTEQELLAETISKGVSSVSAADIDRALAED